MSHLCHRPKLKGSLLQVISSHIFPKSSGIPKGLVYQLCLTDVCDNRDNFNRAPQECSSASQAE